MPNFEYSKVTRGKYRDMSSLLVFATRSWYGGQLVRGTAAAGVLITLSVS
jgi:hypothetical protein